MIFTVKYMNLRQAEAVILMRKAVISVFLFCAGRQRLIFWALYLGLILTAVLGIVYLVGEFTRNQDQ